MTGNNANTVVTENTVPTEAAPSTYLTRPDGTMIYAPWYAMRIEHMGRVGAEAERIDRWMFDDPQLVVGQRVARTRVVAHRGQAGFNRLLAAMQDHRRTGCLVHLLTALP